LLVPVKKVVHDVNAFTRGWSAYFRYGNSASAFDDVMSFTTERMALFVAALHRRNRAYGHYALLASGNRLGLMHLHGIVVAPRPLRGWRDAPNALGEGRR
jgi:RNA-directed DNA polymerase